MPKCQNCDASVLRTDAFCGVCGEPVPGGKPVVPIARDTRSSGTQNAPEPPTGKFEGPVAVAAQAIAVVEISDPVPAPLNETGVTRTTIREREQSEPAPVLPLHRKKNDGTDNTERQSFKEQEPASASTSMAEGERSLPDNLVPPGPPILASDLLRERMRPRAPGGPALRRVTVGLSAAGIVGALLSGGTHPLVFVSLALLISMLTIALTPMSYQGRAVSLFLVGAVATGVALWQQTLQDIAPDGIILAMATILLSGSLLFRAYYRGARLARVAVTIGALALGGWFFLSGGQESLVRLEGYWQSWGPASTQMAFGLLALLSLMAFMDSSTRAGAHWWAYSLLTLYAVYIGLLVASQLWPIPGARSAIEGPTVAAIITGMVGTVVAGVALAQVLVVAYNSAGNRITERSD